jgi:hypothetical protein
VADCLVVQHVLVRRLTGRHYLNYVFLRRLTGSRYLDYVLLRRLTSSLTWITFCYVGLQAALPGLRFAT